MNRKCTSYVMLGVLAMSVLLLSTSPTLAANPLKIESDPTGADVYLYGGVHSGQYLGKTPIYFDVNSNGGINFLKLVKSGYNDGATGVFKSYSMFPFIRVYLNPS